MEVNLITLAIPAFLLLIGIEYYLSKRKGLALYQIDDFANNIHCGILEQVATLPLKGTLMYGYYYLYQHFALLTISPHSPLSWLILWLGVDFLYYCYHRAAHRNAFLWAGHAVHHQSEYYNLSVALRQGIIQTLTSWVVYLPLAVVGFPVWMFIIIASLNTLYQFWIHTQIIAKLGWIEWLFNTPSHHRVHHGKNPDYIDKNYAGSLIIWDKLFGTFTAENEAAEFGTTDPLDSWNPFYANIKVLLDLWRYTAVMDSLWLRLKTYFMPPEWILSYYQSMGLPLPDKSLAAIPGQVPKKWMLINTLMLTGLLCYLLLNYQHSQLKSCLISAFMLFNFYFTSQLATSSSAFKNIPAN